MFRSLSVFVIASLVSCGSGEIREVEILEGNIQSQKDPVIQLQLKAIELGEQAADELMTQQVNKVLQSYNVNHFFTGLRTLSAESEIGAPKTDGPQNCPYVGKLLDERSDTGAASCSFLANEAMEAAFVAMAATIDPNTAIGEEFTDGQGNLADYRTWYMTAVRNTIEINALQVVATLRAASLCDTNPSPKMSAFERGRLVGRQLYIDTMNEHLKAVGIQFDYPNGTKAPKATRYCKKGLRYPTLALIDSRMASTLEQNPLCQKIGSDPLEDSRLLSAYTEVSTEYSAGVTQGVEDEDKKAQKQLKDGGCCVGSPLILDLAGDGISIGPKVAFDLLAAGHRVKTPWIQGDDALLVHDADGDGRILDSSELFGNDGSHDNGFAKLGSHDINLDGVIDARDPVFAALRLWQDADRDGQTTPDELSTLGAMGVKAIELRYTESDRVDHHGNQLRQQGRFLRTAEFAEAFGPAGEITDVWLAYE